MFGELREGQEFISMRPAFKFGVFTSNPNFLTGGRSNLFLGDALIHIFYNKFKNNEAFFRCLLRLILKWCHRAIVSKLDSDTLY